MSLVGFVVIDSVSMFEVDSIVSDDLAKWRTPFRIADASFVAGTSDERCSG